METLSQAFLVIGDFNIDLNKASDPLSKAFSALVDTLGFTQIVHEPPQCSGNTVDFSLSRALKVSALTTSSVSSKVSDHLLITFEGH